MNVVIDTNLWLDMLVFEDARTAQLAAWVLGGQSALRALATPPMRDELERVLRRPLFALSPERQAQLMTTFDASTWSMTPAPDCRLSCRDPDDRMFIDLAVRERCWLLSRDRALLATRRHALARFGVRVGTVADFHKAFPGPALHPPTPSHPARAGTAVQLSIP